MTDPIASIRQILLDDDTLAQLTSGTVFVGEIPRSAISSMPKPCVLIRPAGGGALGTGSLSIGDVRIDATCYGVTLLESWEIHLALADALKHLVSQVSVGTLILWAKESAGGVSGRDVDTDWPTTVSSWQILSGEDVQPPL